MSVAPLVVFRILFGSLIFISSVRFLYLGRLKEQYLDTIYRFTYYGLGGTTSRGLGYVWLICCFDALVHRVCTGLQYSWVAILLFFSFTYVELIDKTYYLNHYYLVSVLALLMVCLPAHVAFSIDAYQNPSIQRGQVTAWMPNFQPDMILEFAQHLARHYKKRLDIRPEVYAQVYVTMNGRPSRLLVSPVVDLAK